MSWLKGSGIAMSLPTRVLVFAKKIDFKASFAYSCILQRRLEAYQHHRDRSSRPTSPPANLDQRVGLHSATLCIAPFPDRDHRYLRVQGIFLADSPGQCDVWRVTRDIRTCDIPRLSGSIVGD